MFWGAEVKDVQAIAMWDNVPISTLIRGIHLHILLSKAARRTNNWHGLPEKNRESRQQEGRRPAGTGRLDRVWERPGKTWQRAQEFTRHTHWLGHHSLPWPLQRGWSRSCPVHAGKVPKSSYQTRNWSLKSGLSGVFSFWDMTRHKRWEKTKWK